MRSFAVLVFAVSLAVTVEGLTKTEYEYVQGLVVDLIESSKDRGYDFVEGFVLVAFHDCVGGCDGCIRLETPQNMGVDRYITPLEELYAKYNLASIIGRADLWALAGAEAVRKGAELAGTACKPGYPTSVVYRWGRVDSPGGPYTDKFTPFPDEYDGLNGTLDFFANTFNFTPRESVALMGVHVVGKMRRENTGYVGQFSRRLNALTNEYYVDMVDSSLNWTQINSNPDKEGKMKQQWVMAKDVGCTYNTTTQSLLNVDLCLFKRLEPNVATGVSGCPIANNCPTATTADFVREYAFNNTLWIDEFSAVYTKMLDNGWSDDQLHLPV